MLGLLEGSIYFTQHLWYGHYEIDLDLQQYTQKLQVCKKWPYASTLPLKDLERPAVNKTRLCSISHVIPYSIILGIGA